ncbi:MAG: sensor histidine kinase, partial [Natronomonas sp.]
LNVILGHAEVLTDADDERVTSQAERILDSGSNLYDATAYVRLLSDILTSHQIQQTRQDVTALVTEIVDKHEKAYPTVTIDSELPAKREVTAAPKLEEALYHVIENAVEHNDSDSPRVEISVQSKATDAGYVEVTIADNGPGIPDQERAVLLEGEETPLHHGSGLGLWIVNWIIHRSGGRIAFEANEPRGSRVTLALPPAE